MSQESTGIHWLLSDTNFILSSNINVFERSNMYGLREAIESDFQTKVEINLDNIIAWKQQFLIKEN